MFYIFFPKYVNLPHLDLIVAPDLDLSWKRNTRFIFFPKFINLPHLDFIAAPSPRRWLTPCRLVRKLKTEYTFIYFFLKYINLPHLDFIAAPDSDASWKRNICFIFFSKSINLP